MSDGCNNYIVKNISNNTTFLSYNNKQNKSNKKKLTIDHNNNVKMILDILYWIYPNASIQVLA